MSRCVHCFRRVPEMVSEEVRGVRGQAEVPRLIVVSDGGKRTRDLGS